MSPPKRRPTPAAGVADWEKPAENVLRAVLRGDAAAVRDHWDAHPGTVAKETQPGRKPIPNRACLTGIVLVLMSSGIPWEILPQEMVCGSGTTCQRRLHDWKQAGVWKTVHRLLLDQLPAVDAIDFKRAVVDSATLRAVGGTNRPAPDG